MNIYQEEILEHFHNPQNFGELQSATHHNCSDNPTCGDKICVELILEKDIITNIGFSGEGCAISQAAGSMLTEHVKNKHVLTLKDMDKDDMLEMLGVELSPNRLKCGLLALESAHKALSSSK